MRVPIPDIHIGLLVLLLWLVIVSILVGAYFLHQWWRKRHPLPRAPQASYSRALSGRLNRNRDATSKGPRARRDGSG